jgi:very-short-patch-repair endonuclease
MWGGVSALYFAMKPGSGAGESREATKTSIAPKGEGGVERFVTLTNHKVANPIRVLGARDFLVVSGSPEKQLAAVAAAQRGRVAQWQLRAVGMSRQMIRTRVRRGTLFVLHRAVYAVGHPGPVELGDETAALLAYGDGTALSHRSACWVWQFLREHPGDMELILPVGKTAKSRPGISVHRSRTVTPADLTIRRGLPVVKPALALLQLAEYGDEREVQLAVDEALAVRAVSRTKLREALAVHGRGRPGAPLIAELAGVRPSSITRSEGEERLRALILAAGLPEAEMQASLHGFTADFYWPEAAYVVEFDGFAFHSSRRAWRRDRVKDRTYAASGIRLDRFTWEDIAEQPMATIAHITRQLTQRGMAATATAGFS